MGEDSWYQPNSDPVGRTALIKRAVRFQLFTMFWMFLEGMVAVWSGVAAHSLSLIAFGADSFIELISAGVVLWRLKVEANRGEEFSESEERFAPKSPGFCCSRSRPVCLCPRCGAFSSDEAPSSHCQDCCSPSSRFRL